MPLSPLLLFTSILASLWHENASAREVSSSIVRIRPDVEYKFMHGIVIDYLTSELIEGVERDDSTQHLVACVEFNLRERVSTGKDCRYSFYCRRPLSHSL